MSLRLKTILGIASIEVFMLAILIWTSLGYLHDTNQQQMANRAQNTTSLLATTAQNAVLSNDLANLDSLAEQAIKNKGLVYVRILDRSGHVLAQQGAIKKNSLPFKSDKDIDSVQGQIFNAASNITVAGVSYGQVQIGIDVSSLITARHEALLHTVLIALAELLMVGLFSWLFSLYLIRQLTNLGRAANNIASGNYGFLVPVKGGDELASTAQAFNQMSQQLAENIAQRETLVQLSPDCILSVDDEGMIIDSNAIIADAFGYEKDEITGKSFLETLIPGSLHGVFQQKIDEVIKAAKAGNAESKAIVQFESKACHADGHSFPIDISVAARLLPQKLVLIIYIRDITERYKTDARLRMLTRAVEQSPASVMLTNTDGALEFVNSKFTEVTGYAAKDVLGQNPRILKSGLTPPDRYIELWKTLTSGKEWEGELINKTSAGKNIWQSVSISPIRDQDGTISHFLAVELDISERKLFEAALEESETRFRSFFADNSSIMLLIEPETGTILSANEAAAQFYGYPLIYLTGKNIREIDTLAPEEIQRHMAEAVSREQNYFIFPHRIASGDIRQVEVYSTKVTYKNRPQLLSIVHDITDRLLAEQRVRESEEKLGIFIEHFPGAVLIESASGCINLANEYFCELFSLPISLTELIGSSCINYLAEIKKNFMDEDLFLSRREDVIRAALPVIGEELLLRNSKIIKRDFIPVVQSGQVISYIWIYRQSNISHYDPLTGLPNRILFSEQIAHLIETQDDGESSSFALVFIDLDDFGLINQNYGRRKGDKLLMSVATRLKQIIKEGDMVGRMGGDEFAIILSDIKSPVSNSKSIESLLQAIAEPFIINETKLKITASAGVTFYPQSDRDVDSEKLIRQAAHCAYDAKIIGKNSFSVFDLDHENQIRVHNERIARIRAGLSLHEFVLFYQPKVNMRTGELVGIEALIRWHHPDKGLLGPNFFLPEVENDPVSIEIGHWVIETALNQLDLWRRQGFHVPLSINIGAMQLGQSQFVDELKRHLDAHPDCRPGELQIEILESSAIADYGYVIEVINACRALGISFAIDDFGTGYSSMAHLKQLPVEALKIDMSFVMKMAQSPEDFSIVQGIVALGKIFNMQLIAEGVEHIETGKLLLQIGCDIGQGYAISRPLPADEFMEWRLNWKPYTEWQVAVEMGVPPQ